MTAAPHADLPMWRDVNADVAQRACAPWDPKPGTLAHVANHGNSVWRFEDAGGTRYLRLSHPSHRTARDTRTELAFVRYLAEAGVPVARPVPANDGAFVGSTWAGDTTLSTCAFEEAPGAWIAPEQWTPAFLETWGHALGRIHAASRRFDPAPDERRWTWREEHLVARADAYLPEDDSATREELASVCRFLDDVEATPETFGMTHADFAPQNFRLRGRDDLTAFDFGNACWHWFASDVAISISVLRNRPNREALRAALVNGYRRAMPFDEASERMIPWFLRLRAVYVVLSRCFAFGPAPTDDQRVQLEAFRSRVGPQAAW